ncbi:DUF883 family protein [Devosia salina]|uniref:DNA gyrase subunit B n=1 Tax=Devosia salina TaxID=2860336 RepID=A0ABX8WAU8_9HYPH|nr:DNA gyrase subunit B [Devosia salina]QYO75913.1 DNA gyrase subunit B [Devosia salina]
MATTSDMAPNRRKTGNGGRSTATTKTPATREEQLEAQVAQLQADLMAISDTLAKLTGEKVGQARSLASAEVKHLQAKGQQMLNEAQDQAGEVEKQLKDTIREKPLTAVAAAAGVGFVLALLTRH